MDAQGDLRDGAQICEITGLLPNYATTSPPAPGPPCAANTHTRHATFPVRHLVLKTGVRFNLGMMKPGSALRFGTDGRAYGF